MVAIKASRFSRLSGSLPVYISMLSFRNIYMLVLSFQNLCRLAFMIHGCLLAVLYLSLGFAFSLDDFGALMMFATLGDDQLRSEIAAPFQPTQ